MATVKIGAREFDALKERLTSIVASLPMGSATRHELETIIALLDNVVRPPVTPTKVLPFRTSPDDCA
jgi:hypothetical protein